ncbi:MAG: DUF3368 domain-containing protein [Brasilonema octagenarum HA4186-MV1]|jgi:hypothetical protein|nr:DUF3368 domain-containing protein [Brasilonema octagenarum HA4186-MV1]
MIIVSDTSVLSNLAAIEQLPLLQQLYNQVIIPEAVRNELSNASTENINIRAVVALSWIEIRLVKNTVLVETLLHNRELDQGEAEAIALALELPAKRLLIDERLGRREATRLGIPITGVLGILIAAKTEGLLPLVKPVMDNLIIKAGFWVSEQLYAEILQVAGE